MEILSIFWGEPHLKLFLSAALRSLSWTDNLKALRGAGATWNIFTDKEHFLEVEKMIDALMPEMEINLGSADDLRRYTDQAQSALVWQIERCLKNNKKMLFVPPDTLFGDGSVRGMLNSAREKNSCVVLPHPRVLPDIFKEKIAFQLGLDNPSLVSLAWRHLHRSWSDAKVGHPLRNSFVGGVSWDEISTGLYTVKHMLPTVYLANFMPEDLVYFQTTGSFGSYDHLWPQELVAQGRQRYVASSDVAFAVEITEKDKNIPPIWPGDPDTFWKDHGHSKMNKQIVATFRGV